MNTEIKTLEQRIKPNAWLTPGETGNILAASMAEAAELRTALEVKTAEAQQWQQIGENATDDLLRALGIIKPVAQPVGAVVALRAQQIDDMVFGYAPNCPIGEGRALVQAALATQPANPADVGGVDEKLVADLRSVYSIYNGHGEDMRDLAHRAADRIAALAAQTAAPGVKLETEVSASARVKEMLAAPQPVDGAAGVKPFASAISYWTGPRKPDGAPNDDPACTSPNRWSEFEPTTLKHGKAISERGDKDKRVIWLYTAAPAPAAPVDFDSLETAHYEPFSNKVGGPRTAVWLDDVRALLAAAGKP